MEAPTNMIIHNDTADLTIAAHIIKSMLDIKFTRAKERHASAMGHASSNHLLTKLKTQAVECNFEQYISVLKAEAFSNHQINLSDEIIERIRIELTQ